MSSPFPLLKWFGSVRGLPAAAVVVVSSAALALYVSFVAVSTTPPTYRPDFGASKWIAPQEAQAAAYFRKDFFISQTVRHAWIYVTAPDTFNLYVNNVKIPGTGMPGATGRLIPGAPTALVDISGHLQPGTNTIAVYVMSYHYKYSARMRIHGRIFSDMSSQDIDSDATWHASSFPGVLNNLVEWTDPTLDEAKWPMAKVVDFPDQDLIQPVPSPDWLMEQTTNAHWISSLTPMPQRINFSRTFERPLGAHDGWLQIATFGKHRISVNGHAIADSSEQPGIVDTTSDSHFHLYWIEPWLRWGKNEVEVRVDDPRATPSVIAQISYKDGGGTPVNLASDASWQVQGIGGKKGSAIDLGIYTYTGHSLGIPPRAASPSPYLASVRTYQFVGGVVFALFLLAIFVFLHLAMADYLVKKGMLTPSQALTLDGLLHLPIFIAVGILTLMSHDIRVRPEWSQSPGWVWLLLLLWVVLRGFAVLHLKTVNRPAEERSPWYENGLAPVFTLVLAVITLVAFILRVTSINLFSLDQDEILINFCAQGIWQRGYPSVDNHGSVLRLTTYELLPFPMALSGLIFGWHDWSMRIPSMLFGTFTAWNIGRMGRELFNPLVGLVTALIYALMPWNVYFAAHCIHPQQTQFFMLLAFWSFYRANQEPGLIDKRQFYKTCFFFICGYLSWEGSAFVLPAFAVALIFLHPGRFGWLRQFHLYAGLLVVVTVIVAQLVYRSTKAEGYRAVGFGLSNLSPRAVFLDQTGSTNYYMGSAMLEQCHLLLGCCLLLGFLFVVRDRPLRYVVLLFTTLLFGYSNFLPVYTDRYFYYYQSMLILGGSASLCAVIRVVVGLAREQGLRTATLVANWCAGVALALLVMVSCALGFRILNFTSQAEDSSMWYGLYWEEARPACEYIASHIRPGDYVAGNYNYSYYYFNGKFVDFTVDQYLDQLAVFTVDKNGYGSYENIYVRVKSFLNERDFIDAFGHCKRLWYMSAVPPSVGPDFVTNLNGLVGHRSRVVYSGFNLNLFLSEGMATKAGETTPDLALPASALPKR